MTPFAPARAFACLSLAALGSTILASLAVAVPADSPFGTQADAMAVFDDLSLATYLPTDEISYDSAIPTPEEVVGFPIGARYLETWELRAYFNAVDEASGRVSVFTFATSHDNRPVQAAIITSPANHSNLSELQAQHRLLSRPDDPRSASLNTANMPGVVFLNYNVHGNEASALNAGLVVLYHLAAATGAEIETFLDEMIVVLVPAINPDGSDRYAFWSNSHAGRQFNADPNHREHTQPWATGRTNYYWHDLNRDYLPVQHPETRGLVHLMRDWKPNVVCDYHEMGTSLSYFFQPGEPDRINPLIPDRNQELTALIANFNAAAMDDLGGLYFTAERYDDFYIGKGSTYTDMIGAVGILYEQGSARGMIQKGDVGYITLPFGIRNQVATSLATLEGAHHHRVDLLDHLREFYASSYREGQAAAAAEGSTRIYAAPHDPYRLREFAALLDAHDVLYHFWSETELAVSLDQPAYRMLTALTERRTEFVEDIFYDVSAWTLPLAFGLEERDAPEGAAPQSIRPVTPQVVTDDTYAVLIDWRGLLAGQLLYDLLDAKIFARAVGSAFSIEVDGETVELPAGSIVIPAQQPNLTDAWRQRLSRGVHPNGVTVYHTSTGLTPAGNDLGTTHALTLEKPVVAILTGFGIDTYDAGHLWYYFDTRLEMPVTLLDVRRFSFPSLDQYTHLFLPEGTYSTLGASHAEAIEAWVRNGGTAIALADAVRWLDRHDVVSVAFREEDAEDDEEDARRNLSDNRADVRYERVSGAIFEVHLDLSHPLNFGFTSDHLAIFRTHEHMLELSNNPYATPLAYTDEPLLAGYISEANAELMAGSAAGLIDEVGAGRVIILPDRPVFRSHWLGTMRFINNAVFFGPWMDEPTLP